MSPSEPLPDNEILARMRQGDESAFLDLYGRHADRVFRFALLVGGCRASAADVTQETFMALMLDSKGFNPAQGEIGAYLCGIARNLLRRQYRYSQRLLSLDATDDNGVFLVGPMVNEHTPLQSVLADERSQAVHHALMQLPLGYREAIVLCELQEMSYADAAITMGCAVGTVRSRLHRARSLLLDQLKRSERATMQPKAIISQGEAP